jgi:hypothetical protein
VLRGALRAPTQPGGRFHNDVVAAVVFQRASLRACTLETHPARTGGRAMTDPAGSDRLQQDVPTASGTGDNSSTGSDSFDDVPLTQEEAAQRDAASPDDLPAKADSDVAAVERAGPADGL